MKLWEGRFAQATAADADAFNECLSFDRRLYAQDIRGSVAHATMLGECGILSKEESRAICEGLDSILRDIESGALEVTGYEDIHSFVEGKLVERIGDTGKKNCTPPVRATTRWRPISACTSWTPSTA